MSDDPKKKGQHDRSRINPSEDYEVRYWSKKFGVSPDELKAAVKKVGQLGCRRATRTESVISRVIRRGSPAALPVAGVPLFS
jgi:uncharacterized protein DUF3606